MIQSIARYLIALLLAYLVGHGVITQQIADKNVAALTNYLVIAVTLVGTLLWSFLEKKYKGVLAAYFPNTVGRTPPSANGIILLALAVGGCALLSGCASTLPSQFDNVTPPLSATDTKIVEGAAALDTPAALAGIESGASVATTAAMAVFIKQPSTMQTDGLLLYGCGQEMESLPSGSIDPTAIDDIFTGAKANASTAASAASFAQLGTALDGLLGAGRTYVTQLASSSTNPSVAAYLVTVFGDDVHAAGKGICDATIAYAPAATTTRLELRLPRLFKPQHLLALDL
jgi:hypothetical protein